MVDGLLDGALGDVDRMLAVTAEDRNANLAAERGQLVGSGGTIDVARGEQRRATLLLEQVGQLYGRRGLTGTLQTHEHDDIGDAVAKDELALVGAEHLGELVEHNLDDVLRRRQRLHDLGGHAALLGLGDELLDDLKVDVGLEQSHANVAHGRGDIGLGQLTLAAQAVKCVVEAIAQGIKHWLLLSWTRPPGRGRNLWH